MAKLFGIALLIGGSLVGIIIFWLTNLYLSEGKLTAFFAVIFIVIGFLFIVAPQLAMGIYILKSGKDDSKPL